MGSDEFIVHLISLASMDYFPDNTLASFRNFCEEEIDLARRLESCILRNNFPHKIKQCY